MPSDIGNSGTLGGMVDGDDGKVGGLKLVGSVSRT